MVRAMCGEQLKNRKIFTDLMITVGCSETIDQLATANSVRRHDHALRREDVNVLGRALDYEVNVKGRTKRAWKKQVWDKSATISLRREDALCQSKWSVGIKQIDAGLT